MKMLQELAALREGMMKNAMMDVIEKAVARTPIAHKSYADAVAAIVKYARAHDNSDILAGSGDEELSEYVMAEFSEDDYHHVNEEQIDELSIATLADYGKKANLSRDVATKNAKMTGTVDQKTINKMDNRAAFTMRARNKVMAATPQPSNEDHTADGNYPKLIAQSGEYRVELDEDGIVHILDGEHVIRLSMPASDWDELSK